MLARQGASKSAEMVIPETAWTVRQGGSIVVRLRKEATMTDQNGQRPRALITGASSGLGLVFAEKLAERGHDVVLVARRRDRLVEVAGRIKSRFGVDAEVQVADLAKPNEVLRLERRIADDPSLSILINNAGFGGYEPFVSLDPEIADRLIDVNVRAVTRLTRAALPGMVERKSGAVLNIASLLGLSGPMPPNPLPHRATYAAAKAYVIAFTQALAGELQGTGVRLTVVLPGRVATEFFTIQGMDMTRMPPMMSPEDLVEGALAGLDTGEVVCIPALDDETLLQNLAEAQATLVRTAGMQPQLAGRYRRS
jgi:short-subunit dehydrogenase